MGRRRKMLIENDIQARVGTSKQALALFLRCTATSHTFSRLPMPPGIAKRCRFYEAGYCRYGNACRYEHDPVHYVPFTEGAYMPISYAPPLYTGPQTIPISPVVYPPPPFWAYDPHSQFSPSPSQYHVEEVYNNPVHHSGFVSRSHSIDSSSSFTTNSSYLPSDQAEVVAEGDTPYSETTIDNAPSHRHSVVKSKSNKIQPVPTVRSRAVSKTRNKETKYKTVQCKFYRPATKYCPKGDDCTFIHSTPSNPSLPSKPLTRLEAEREKGYFPVTWRVIGGGVLMGVSGANKPNSETELDDQSKKGPSSAPSNVLSVSTSREVLPPVLSLDLPGITTPRKRTRSSPSTPVKLDLAGIFPAESP
ncbi:hypothetical protein BT96DRAFT_1013062 [Gymnopus androsaceus JB14]|uniref:C3H1-type domain-containing protein n=1 Tax=Gymnopus androsaceus JB14 TaxID=1447944 RepID=A0A6A4IFZ1_9AGAR|nr:hypothetical protein BT96DRAFT_1013062 [Gymnopus androsaceus JB14]